MLFFILDFKNWYFKISLLLSFLRRARSNVAKKKTFRTPDYCSLLYCIYDTNPLPIFYNVWELRRQYITNKITFNYNITYLFHGAESVLRS